tara:strand:+ start:1576 stop:2463 length:888 start_codon:yes stop_codon:yes gene_type:complete
MSPKKESVDIEMLWSYNIAKAKEYIGVKTKNQMAIAALALEVCEISWGGSSKDYKFKYTLTRFAKESGVNLKSLSHWIAVYKLVYQRIGQEACQKVSFSKMLVVANQVSKDSPIKHVKEVFKHVTGEGSVDAKAMRYVSDLKSMSYMFQKKDAAKHCSKETLEEALYFLDAIKTCILKEKPETKPVNHNLCNKFHQSNAPRAAKALFGPSKRSTVAVDVSGTQITGKDKQIINYIRQSDKYFSPTELGQKLGGFNVANAKGSAWAYRTLNKLQGLGHVEKNDRGHYRWIGGEALG